MDGIAFQDRGPGWNGLIPLLDSAFDEFLWFYDCQSGWNVRDLDYDGLDAVLEQCLIPIPTIENTSTCLIERGCFSKAFPWFGCDEWTYLVGFQSEERDYENCAKYLTRCLTRACFEALEEYDGILIVCVADWWECFPKNHSLLPLLGSSLNRASTHSDKWIAYENEPRVNVRPEFDL